MSKSVEVGVHYWPSRAVPPSEAAAFAKQLVNSGVVDWFQTWDQLVSFFPQGLWRPEVTPMASVMPDCDSFHDHRMIAAIAATAADGLGVTTTTDAVRNGPAELLQSMYTLASAAGGKASIQIGAGEVKQCKPFGYRRSEGLARLEDTFRIIRQLIDTDGLVDFKGHRWTYDGAWIGATRPAIPQFWALGGGPKLMDIATSYADGVVSLAPLVYRTPEEYAADVKRHKEALERKGRDPEKFTFGLWPVHLLYDDDEQRDRLLNNPLMKFHAACFGRLNHSQWREEGFDLIFPTDWHYSTKLLPAQLSQSEINRIVDQVTPERVERSYIVGTPAEAAEEVAAYIEAGATFIAPFDMCAAALRPDEQEDAVSRMLEVCGIIKGAKQSA